MPPSKFVAYFRVSTDKQGRSGLGLEAQQDMVERHLAAVGGVLVGSFTEVESGKRDDRPELEAALSACRRHRAVLVVAKLDRLSRNVAFTARLMESRTKFLACDMPEANELTIHIMAAMAQHERKAISARTKAALAAKKARGEVMGFADPRRSDAAACAAKGSKKAAVISAEVRCAAVIEHAADLREVVLQLREEGVTSLRKIADRLNQEGILTRLGRPWNAEGVRQLLTSLAT